MKSRGTFWWYKKFQSANCRLTLPRQAVIEILSSAGKHLTAEETLIRLQTRYPGIGIATVYRALDILTRIGIVDKLDFGEGKSRYELKGPQREKHHYHLICKKCGKIIDYSDFVEEEKELVKKIEKVLSERHGFKIEGHNFQFHGLCARCKLRR